MQRRPSEQPFTQQSSLIQVGPLELDPAGFAVRVNGNDISLTFAEFLLLSEFVQHPYQVLGRERLATLVRENIGASNRGEASSRSVDTHIARLRGKLRRKGYDCIKTMRFVGYRLVPPGLDDDDGIHEAQ